MIPEGNALQQYLNTLYRDYAALDEGEVASYIPELTKADPAWFGIALVTVDGHVYQSGDTRQAFTIQSISKAITYGLALDDSGIPSVLGKVDVEPSGEAFNEISLEPGTGRPRNPMINAGAIATVALIAGDTADEKLARMLKTYERYLGRQVTIDEEVYRSEKSTGHRNRAIAYLLRNSNIIEKDTDEILDVYFKQCSILVDCRDLALMGATLANDGVNPITSVRALTSPLVPKVLSVMNSCGMYDYSGAWVYEVGMPAKSGVGGGVMAVLPGQFGLAVFSPKLDVRGNSVRGIAACKKISSDFGLHVLQTGRMTTTSVIHVRYNAAQIPSKRSRAAIQTRALSTLGERVVVFELAGDLVFSSAEIIVSEAMGAMDTADFLILDFRRAPRIAQGAVCLLVALIQSLGQGGKTVLLTGIADKFDVAREIRRRVTAVELEPLLGCEDVDHALEWCEDRLLADHAATISTEVPLAHQAFCEGFSPEELAGLEVIMERRDYAPGAAVCREGEVAESIFFILRGQVSVNIPLEHRRAGRISMLSAGSAFGEMALFDQGVRTADIIADGPVTCLELDFARLEADSSPLHARIRYQLVRNIARGLSRKLRQLTGEVRLLRR
ncbi:glutaminase A [Methylotetracoccus oryzae]|uniref:glutaminase A n=1 Tax=Methylotetracoccus oryzae TaxID=1919059 RepID=UPI001118BE3C|nr:glutaminase A [Methylotetracoccus oryzae]